jgi:hypothetical protein
VPYPKTVVSFDQFVGAQDEARRDFKADVAPPHSPPKLNGLHLIGSTDELIEDQDIGWRSNVRVGSKATFQERPLLAQSGPSRNTDVC